VRQLAAAFKNHRLLSIAMKRKAVKAAEQAASLQDACGAGFNSGVLKEEDGHSSYGLDVTERLVRRQGLGA